MGADRATIHFADLTGNGKADYLVVDAKTGAVKLWENGGGVDSRGVWIWNPRGTVALGVGEGVFWHLRL